MDATTNHLQHLDVLTGERDRDAPRLGQGASQASASGTSAEYVGTVPPLQRRSLELQRQLGELGLDADAAPTATSTHLADDARDRQEQTHARALAAILRSELRQVEHALERAANGLYGICEHCAQPIPPRRLLIIPAATLCVPCQTRHEARTTRH